MNRITLYHMGEVFASPIKQAPGFFYSSKKLSKNNLMDLRTIMVTLRQAQYSNRKMGEVFSFIHSL